MRNYCKTIAALAITSAFATGSASALDLDYSLSAGYSSSYIWRNIFYGNDLTETGGGVSTSVAGLDLSAGFWQASFEPFGNEHYNELDTFGSVSKDLEFVTASIGYIRYHYYNDYDDSQEAIFGLSRDFGFVSVGLTYFWDIETDNDGYTELALSKSYELTSCLSLSTSVAVGYFMEPKEWGHATGRVSLDYQFTENATISPYVLAGFSLGDDQNAANVGTKNQLVGGVLVSVSF